MVSTGGYSFPAGYGDETKLTWWGGHALPSPEKIMEQQDHPSKTLTLISRSIFLLQEQKLHLIFYLQRSGTEKVNSKLPSFLLIYFSKLA